MVNGVRAKDVDVKIMLTRNAARVANAVFMVVSPYDYYCFGESWGKSIRIKGYELHTPIHDSNKICFVKRGRKVNH